MLPLPKSFPKALFAQETSSLGEITNVVVVDLTDTLTAPEPAGYEPKRLQPKKPAVKNKVLLRLRLIDIKQPGVKKRLEQRYRVKICSMWDEVVKPQAAADVPSRKRVRTVTELKEEEPLIPKASLGHNRKHPTKSKDSIVEQVLKPLDFAEVFLAPEAGEEFDEMKNNSEAKKPAEPIYELINIVD
jgi:hypothetical protein